MSSDRIIATLREENPEALLADGFDRALIGITENHHMNRVAVYSAEMCVQILVDSGMSEREADDFLQFNTYGAYVGENGPIYVRSSYCD
jgi:hypothetical protein